MKPRPNVPLVVLAQGNNPIFCYASGVSRVAAVRNHPSVFSIEFEQALSFGGEPKGSVFVFEHRNHADWHHLAGICVVKRKVRERLCSSIECRQSSAPTNRIVDNPQHAEVVLIK